MKIILAVAVCTLFFIGSAMAAGKQQNNLSPAPVDNATPTPQVTVDPGALLNSYPGSQQVTVTHGFGSGTNIGKGGHIGSPTSLGGGFGSAMSNSGFGGQTFGGGFTQQQAGGSGPLAIGSTGSAGGAMGR